MLHMLVKWNEIKHLRVTSFLSNATLELLKEQVYRTLRDQEKDSLFEQFMKWQGKDNEIMLYANYSLTGFDLPVNFDSITQVAFPDNRTDVKIVIPYSIINGWAPINKIGRGHRHVCLLQFDDEVPEIIKGLPEVNSKNGSAGYEVILYNVSDIASQSGG